MPARLAMTPYHWRTLVLTGLLGILGLLPTTATASGALPMSPSDSSAHALYRYDLTTVGYDKAPNLASCAAPGSELREASAGPFDDVSGPFFAPSSELHAPRQLLNRAGRAYPEVLDPRTGRVISQPPTGLTRVPVSERVPWGSQERGAFIKQWYDQGLDTPAGGWADYDIHHIVPREFGGTNAFDNLVPVPRTLHQQEFNAWWRNY